MSEKENIVITGMARTPMGVSAREYLQKWKLTWR